jgi:hypothetical protein
MKVSTLSSAWNLSLGSSRGPFSFSLNYVVETDDDVLAVDEDFYFTIGASL